MNYVLFHICLYEHLTACQLNFVKYFVISYVIKMRIC
jgi:hypothetical protein